MKPGRKQHVCGVGRFLSNCRGCQAYKRTLKAQATGAAVKGLLCRCCKHSMRWDDVLAMFICRCPLPPKEDKP